MSALRLTWNAACTNLSTNYRWFQQKHGIQSLIYFERFPEPLAAIGRCDPPPFALGQLPNRKRNASVLKPLSIVFKFAG